MGQLCPQAIDLHQLDSTLGRATQHPRLYLVDTPHTELIDLPFEKLSELRAVQETRVRALGGMLPEQVAQLTKMWEYH